MLENTTAGSGTCLGVVTRSKNMNRLDNSDKLARLVADLIKRAAANEYVDAHSDTELYDDLEPEDNPAGVGIHYVCTVRAPYRRSNNPTAGNYSISPDAYEYSVEEATIWAGEDCEEEFDITDDVQKILNNHGNSRMPSRFLRKRDLAESSLLGRILHK